MLMQIWAYPNYRDSDIAAIAISIVIYYCDISHYKYYHSALVSHAEEVKPAEFEVRNQLRENMII